MGLLLSCRLCLYHQGFPGGSAGKESSCSGGDLGSFPGLGRSAGEGNGYPLQCSGLENSMDCIVHRIPKSQTGLSNFPFHIIRAFPGGTSSKEPVCQCRRWERFWFHPWARKIPWRRKWQPTPVFLPGESHGRGAWWAIVHGVAKSQT